MTEVEGLMLSRAIRARLYSRNLTLATFAGRAGGSHYSALWRVVHGRTLDPRTSTLLAICAGLDTDPTHLLREAGLWPKIGPV